VVRPFAVLTRLAVDELQRRYAAGERVFYNANLRCALLTELNLVELNSLVKAEFS